SRHPQARERVPRGRTPGQPTARAARQLRHSDPSEDCQVPPMNSTPPPTATVLVVDDTQETLRFLTDTLEAAGISVLIATSGEIALELFDHIVPDLVLMDAVMPGLDGFETTRAIKATAAGAQV